MPPMSLFKNNNFNSEWRKSSTKSLVGKGISLAYGNHVNRDAFSARLNNLYFCSIPTHHSLFIPRRPDYELSNSFGRQTMRFSASIWDSHPIIIWLKARVRILEQFLYLKFITELREGEPESTDLLLYYLFLIQLSSRRRMVSCRMEN